MRRYASVQTSVELSNDCRTTVERERHPARIREEMLDGAVRHLSNDCRTTVEPQRQSNCRTTVEREAFRARIRHEMRMVPFYICRTTVDPQRRSGGRVLKLALAEDGERPNWPTETDKLADQNGQFVPPVQSYK